MKPQEIAIYQEIQRSTDRAIKAMDMIADKVYDENLGMQVSKQNLQYSKLHNAATEQLIGAKAENYRSTYLEDMKLRGSLHYDMFLNTSTGRIAEVMIKNCNHDILQMEKILHHNPGADEASTKLARHMIAMAEDNIKSLKEYL